jgi:uncharacterized protein YodC (DUF2158 family)
MFKIDDEVQLKSGSPTMTVDEITGPDFICTWFDDHGAFQIDAFTEDQLVLAEKQIPDAIEDTVDYTPMPLMSIPTVTTLVDLIGSDSTGPLSLNIVQGSVASDSDIAAPSVSTDLVGSAVPDSNIVESEPSPRVTQELTPCRCVNPCPGNFCASTTDHSMVNVYR